MGVRRISPSTHIENLLGTSLRLIDGPYTYIYAGTEDNSPGLRYNVLTLQWEYSNNGITWNNFSSSGSGSFGDDSVKLTELVASPILSETTHSLPGVTMYSMASGSKLDVYLNGQLLTHDKPLILYDYVETSSTTIQFHFNVPTKSLLTYIIK